jgi:hypothetical protein
MAAFIAFIMKPMGDIDWIQTYRSEAEADEFAIKKSSYSELHPDDDPDHWKKYDPPVVIVFEAENTDAMENGKYTRPVAIFQRGEKYACVKPCV